MQCKRVGATHRGTPLDASIAIHRQNRCQAYDEPQQGIWNLVMQGEAAMVSTMAKRSLSNASSCVPAAHIPRSRRLTS